MDNKIQGAKNLLIDANHEIKILRRQNELMNARLEMFDAMTQLLHTNPATKNCGMSPDVVQSIEMFLRDIE